MTIGSGIALIVIGAILMFGFEDVLPGVNLDAIGLILMVAGVAGIVIGLVMQASRRGPRKLSRTQVVEEHDTATGHETITRTDDRRN